MNYRARIVSLSLIALVGFSGGYQVSMELQGEGTPPVFAFDGVRLEMTRVASGESAPPVPSIQAVQVLNGVVSDVHNNAPSNALLVNVSVQGAAPSLSLFEGDIVDVNLLVVSSTANTSNPPPGGTPPSGTGTGGIPYPINTSGNRSEGPILAAPTTQLYDDRFHTPQEVQRQV